MLCTIASKLRNVTKNNNIRAFSINNIPKTIGSNNTVVDQHFSNITPAIADKVGTNLHLRNGHPLNTIKTIIEKHFHNTCNIRTAQSVLKKTTSERSLERSSM